MRGFTVTLHTTPELAEAAVRETLAAEGFGVLTEIDVAATFKAKLGIERPPLKILGACNPHFAHAALEFDPSLALLLPCNIVIEQGADGVTVNAADPRELINEEGMEALASDAAAKIERALDAVVDRFASTTTA